MNYRLNPYPIGLISDTIVWGTKNLWNGILYVINSLKPSQTKTKKRARLPMSVRHECWVRECGQSLQGHCYACRKPLAYIDFEAGHIIAVANGGTNEISNLRPICRPCNLSMGTMEMNEYIKTFGTKQT